MDGERRGLTVTQWDPDVDRDLATLIRESENIFLETQQVNEHIVRLIFSNSRSVRINGAVQNDQPAVANAGAEGRAVQEYREVVLEAYVQANTTHQTNLPVGGLAEAILRELERSDNQDDYSETSTATFTDNQDGNAEALTAMFTNNQDANAEALTAMFTDNEEDNAEASTAMTSDLESMSSDLAMSIDLDALSSNLDANMEELEAMENDLPGPAYETSENGAYPPYNWYP